MVKIARNQAKAVNSDYHLWHPTAMTKDSDLLVVCGVLDVDSQTTIAIPIHKTLAAKSANFFSQFAKTQAKQNCSEIVIDTFRPKTMLNYFRSLYDETIKVSSKNCVELYCLAKFLKDEKLEKLVTENIKVYIRQSALTAFDCFGLFFMTNDFDETIYVHIKEQKSLKFAKCAFVWPQNDRKARKVIKKMLQKAEEPIAKIPTAKLVKFIESVGDSVEVECLYFITKLWLRGENKFEELKQVLEAECALKSSIRTKWKLYRSVLEWLKHHSPSEADANSVESFNIIFKHEDGVEKVEDLDTLPDDTTGSSPERPARLATPARAKRLVKKLSRTLSQISIQAKDHKNSTMRRDIGEIRRFEDIVGVKKEADASSVISDDPFGGFSGPTKKEAAPEVKPPKWPANAARENNDSGNSSGLAGSGEQLQIRFAVQRAGGLIGQGGSNIKELKSCSDAAVELDGPRNSRDLIAKLKDPGMKNKIQKLFTIEGDKVECFKVLDKMLEFLDYNGNCGVSLLVEPHLAGSLIGKGGSVIKQLKEESECRINIDKEPYEESTEKIVKLYGESDRVNPLLKKILEKLTVAKARAKNVPEESKPWFPTVPVEWLEGYESEKDSDSDSSDSDDADAKPGDKRAADGSVAGSPASKKAKSDDEDGFF